MKKIVVILVIMFGLSGIGVGTLYGVANAIKEVPTHSSLDQVIESISNPDPVENTSQAEDNPEPYPIPGPVLDVVRQIN